MILNKTKANILLQNILLNITNIVPRDQNIANSHGKEIKRNTL